MLSVVDSARRSQGKMNGKAKTCLVILSILSGCGDGGVDAPELSTIEPAVIPSYVTPRLTLHGAGFFPIMGVSTVSGQAVVADDQFTVRLVPTRPLDAGCVPGEILLREVAWEGADRLSGQLPAGGCAAEYAVRVTDPRGATTAEEPSFTLSPVWPDHLRIVPQPCTAAAAAVGEEVEITLGDAAAFSVRVVGPGGEPIAAFPSDLKLAAPVDVDATVLLAAEDDLVDAAPVVSSLTAVAPLEGEFARLEGPLGELGCADLVITGTQPGRMRLSASTGGLPRRGDVPGPLSVLVQPEGSLALSIDVPEVVTAGEAFAVAVEALDRETGARVETAEACLEIRANDQPLILVSRGGAADFSCAAGLPMVRGRWSGSVMLEEADDRAFLLGSTQYGVFGASAVFEVVAGEAKALAVTAPQTVVAGAPFELRASLLDAWGNLVEVDPAALGVPKDKTGTLSCPAPPEVVGRQATFSGCTLTRVVAANDISLTYGDALSGRSAAFVSHAGAPTILLMDVPPGPHVAGVSFPVAVTLTDSYGNMSDTSTGVEISFKLASTASLAVARTSLTEGHLETTAQAFTAREDILSAEVVGLKVSAPLTVVHASAVRLAVAGSVEERLAAGDFISLSLTAVDAWENRDLSYAPPGGISVKDAADQDLVSGAPVVFTAGVGALDVQVIRVTESEVLTVSDAAGRSGTLGGIAVDPGPLAAFAIQDMAPPYWVGEPFAFEIHAQDAFGNLVPSFQGSVKYAALAGGVLPEASGPFEGGIRRERFRLSAAGDDSAIIITAEGPGGQTIRSETARFLVLRECEDGSTVELALLNLTDEERGTLCLAGRLTDTRLDAQALVTGASTQALKYLWNDGDRGLQSTVTSSYSFGFSDEGYHPVSVTVQQLPNLCGIRASRDVFVGKAGSPTGALSMSAEQLILYAGHADGTERTQVTVTARDCAGEAVTRGEVLTVLSSYGDIRAIDAAPARPGIQTNMTQGVASFTLSVGNEQQSTIATVVAGTSTGSAIGSLDLEIRNDILNPWVVDYGPSGYRLLPVQTAWVRFSEPMLPESILENDFLTLTLEGVGAGRELTRGLDYVLSLDDTRTVLTFTFLPLGQGQSLDGVVRVTLPSEVGGYNVEDENGQRLDGNWDGILDPNDAFSFQIGAVPDLVRPEVLSCQPSPVVYTPAQYDVGQGADNGITISAALSDDLSLRSWRLEVYDLHGETVYEKYGVVPAHASLIENITWYGVCMDGPVVPNGTYWYEVAAIDSHDNVSEGVCQGWIEIANPLDLSPL